MASHFIFSIKGFEMFWWCFPIGQVSSLFNLQHVHIKLKQTLATWAQNWARVCFSFLWIYERSNKLENHQVLLALFCLKYTSFDFCLCSELLQWLNMGGESCMVLRLRWMHKLAISRVSKCHRLTVVRRRKMLRFVCASWKIMILFIF